MTGLERRRDRAVAFPVKLPADAETFKPGLALFPANASGMRQFAKPPVTEAEGEVTPHVVEPSKQKGPRPIDLRRMSCPHGRERAGLAEVTAVNLFRRVIV
jgi:hypothetical protein